MPKTQKPWSLLARITCGYLLFLLVLLPSLHWVGERNWVLGVFIYLPVHLWLLPLAILTPVCLFYQPRLCLLHVGCVLFILFIYQPFRWSRRRAPEAETLTLLTNNVANNNHQSLQPFIQAENPDIIALVDAANRRYPRDFPDRFVATCDQFVLISKYPIISATLLRAPSWLGHPVAARYEIGMNGAPLVIYTVHLPTPRPDFAKLRGLGLLREIRSDAWNRKRSDGQSFHESMAARIELARVLVRQISEEKQPYLLMGDFNMPDHGTIYHLFASEFTDAFAQTGRGWGLTFPGFGNRGFGMLGPWLRIDYIFAGKGWKPIECRTEPDRRSKHRAVMARMERVKRDAETGGQ